MTLPAFIKLTVERFIHLFFRWHSRQNLTHLTAFLSPTVSDISIESLCTFRLIRTKCDVQNESFFSQVITRCGANTISYRI